TSAVQPEATTPVGTYADRGDASPCGAHDLAGNVWEWTSTLYASYPYRQSDGRENPDFPGNRMMRGGSWAYGPRMARTACRLDVDPGDLSVGTGFRLVLAPLRVG